MTGKRAVFLGLGLFFLIGFAIFTLIAKLDLLTQIDFDLTVKIQNRTPLRLDAIFSFLSLLGRFDVAMVFLIILSLRLKKKISGFTSLVLFASAHVVELIGKLYLDHPGPPFMFYRNKSNLLFPELYVVGSSYPSGHSLRAMFLAAIFSYLIFISLKKNKYLRFSLTVFVWIVAFSLAFGKIVLGQHWTSDVVGGMLLGLGFGFFSIFAISNNKS